MQVEEAVEVFGQGFATLRSFTYPFEFTRIGGLWVLRDSPPRKRCRTEEVLALGLEADIVLQEVSALRPAKRLLCVITDASESVMETRHHYKRLGCRALHSESLMAFGLTGKENTADRPGCRRVREQYELDALKQANRVGLLPPEYLHAGPHRLYAAFDENSVTGWVRSTIVKEKNAYVSSMYVLPHFRRRGIGRDLLATMHCDLATDGIQTAVLLASSVGEMLYSSVDYEKLGTLQVFTLPTG